MQNPPSAPASDAGSSDKDAARAVVSDVPREIDPSVEKRVLRKIDLFFMPAMVIGMFPTYLLSSFIDAVLTDHTGYGIVYWDKVGIPYDYPGFYLTLQAILGSATLFGMIEDLSLSVVDHSTSPPSTDTSRLSWATSIFYFGMLAGLYPMTFFLQRFNLQYVFGPIVMAWAITCAATAGVTSWQGLFVQRFFLGLFPAFDMMHLLTK